MNDKICNKCKIEKSLDQFSPRIKGKDGVNSVCKECCTKEMKGRYKNNPELYKARAREYRKLNPERYKEIHKKYKDSNPKRKLLDGSKYRAKKKGIENTLTIEDINIPEICPILGIKLEYNKEKVKDNSPSLDRIDSSKGYTSDNIHIISHKANRIKNHLSKDEIIKLLNYVNGNTV